MEKEINSKGNLKFIIIAVVMLLGSIPITIINFLMQYNNTGKDIYYIAGAVLSSYIFAIIISFIIYFTRKIKRNLFFMFCLISLIFSGVSVCNAITDVVRQNGANQTINIDDATISVPKNWVVIDEESSGFITAGSRDSRIGCSLIRNDNIYISAEEHIENFISDSDVYDQSKTKETKLNGQSVKTMNFTVEYDDIEREGTLIITKEKAAFYILYLWHDEEYDDKEDISVLKNIKNSLEFE